MMMKIAAILGFGILGLQALCTYYSVPTGQEKLDKVREFVLLVKGQGKYYFGQVREKLREMILGSCRLQIQMLKSRQMCSFH